MAKSFFESLLQRIIPEINFLTASGAGLKPGHLMESLDTDVIVGYLPEHIGNLPSMAGKDFDNLVEEAYDIKLNDVTGSVSHGAALQVMKILGLSYEAGKTYRIGFELDEIRSVKFGDNLEKINFEIALDQLRQQDKPLFKRLKGYFLVVRVMYANKYKITVEIERNGKFEADVEVKNVKVEGNVDFKTEENALIISHNSEVPFGVIGFKIKKRGLKEQN